jgi:xylulokinase
MRVSGDGEVAISMGTSDTVFASLNHPRPSKHEGTGCSVDLPGSQHICSGHIFCNPTTPNGYMALVCYKNGSLTREDVRDRVAGASWPKFDQLLKASPAGNDGNLGFFFKETEITPQGYVESSCDGL